MRIKFETKSNRVKGLSFHPKRSWILASLHSGTIQLWDYQLQTLVDTFIGHDGPVRGIAFHDQQPIFVSGGDDYTVKVWSYQKRKCMFTLAGHIDYVRAVSFHHKQPWILSAADDQTIRIWNWQNRQQICLLTGHTHYIMSAQFHPTDDLVVSASLDQNVRIWDITILRQKYNPDGRPASAFARHNDTSLMVDTGNTVSRVDYGAGLGGNRTPSNKADVDYFAQPGGTCRNILEGHERGVNYAAFHPTLPFIASCGDDRLIKLWRMTDNRIFEVNTFRGHYNNISCLSFHRKMPYIISVSEDKSIRIWDISNHTSVKTFRREQDRWWASTAHPTENLFAGGHDSGLVIFKLERERPTWATHNDIIYYIKENYLRKFDTSCGRDSVIMQLQERDHNKNHFNNRYNLSYNPAENLILLTTHKGQSQSWRSNYCEIYIIPSKDDTNSSSYSSTPFKKSCRNAIWTSRNKFGILTDDGKVEIHCFTLSKNGDPKKKQQNALFSLSCNADCRKDVTPNINIFWAGTGFLLVHQTDRIVLFDIQKRAAVGQYLIDQHPKKNYKIKHVCWSSDMRYVALLGKYVITICDRNLRLITTWQEFATVKSGAWEESCINNQSNGTEDVRLFIYNTSTNLKFALTNGDTGIIRTLEVPIYIAKVKVDKIYCFTKEAKTLVITVDPSEYMFKLALLRKSYDQVVQMVKNTNMIGQATVAYLYQRGYPEIALQFVQKDVKTRFNLALKCMDINVALEAAKMLESESAWNKLSEIAMLIGNHQVAEMCYHRTRNYSKLAFLYLVTGNQEKLIKVQKIVMSLKETTTAPAPLKYTIALFSGDIRDRVKILKDSGNRVLAHVTAVVHGFSDDTESLETAIQMEALKTVSTKFTPKLLTPPIPLVNLEENWPLLNVSRGAFEKSAVSCILTQHGKSEIADQSTVAGTGGWDYENDNPLEETGESGGPGEFTHAEEEGDWKTDVEIDLPPTELVELNETSYVFPTKGIPFCQELANESMLPIDSVIAGDFHLAAKLLQEKHGIVNIQPFKEIFLDIFAKSRVFYTPVPNQPTSALYPLRESRNKFKASVVSIITLDYITKGKLKSAYDTVNAGKFVEGVESYKNILLNIPFVALESKADISKAKALIFLCKEYILGMQMELYRKSLSNTGKAVLTEQVQRRSCELAAYFTHCDLDNVHLILALRTAMNLCFKARNYNYAATFARRLLELGPIANLALVARKMIQVCERNGMANSFQLNYHEHNPFSICGKTYIPIYKGTKSAACAFCEASYQAEFEGILCNICGVARVVM